MKKLITFLLFFIFVFSFILTASSYTHIQKPYGYYQLTNDVQDIVDEAMQEAYEQALDDVEYALSMKTYYNLPLEIQNHIEEIEEDSIEEVEKALSMEQYYKISPEIEKAIEDIQKEAYKEGYEAGKEEASDDFDEKIYFSTKSTTLFDREKILAAANKMDNENQKNTDDISNEITTQENSPADSKSFDSIPIYSIFILLGTVVIILVFILLIKKRKVKKAIVRNDVED